MSLVEKLADMAEKMEYNEKEKSKKSEEEKKKKEKEEKRQEAEEGAVAPEPEEDEKTASPRERLMKSAAGYKFTPSEKAKASKIQEYAKQGKMPENVAGAQIKNLMKDKEGVKSASLKDKLMKIARGTMAYEEGGIVGKDYKEEMKKDESKKEDGKSEDKKPEEKKEEKKEDKKDEMKKEGKHSLLKRIFGKGKQVAERAVPSAAKPSRDRLKGLALGGAAGIGGAALAASPEARKQIQEAKEKMSKKGEDMNSREKLVKAAGAKTKALLLSGLGGAGLVAAHDKPTREFLGDVRREVTGTNERMRGKSELANAIKKQLAEYRKGGKGFYREGVPISRYKILSTIDREMKKK